MAGGGGLKRPRPKLGSTAIEEEEEEYSLYLVVFRNKCFLMFNVNKKYNFDICLMTLAR
jgi:hypothetical protein